MKKKEWYELLNTYNEMIENREVYHFMVNEEELQMVRTKIINYLTKIALVHAEVDTAMIWEKISNQGYADLLAKEKFLKSWIAKWAKKADSIIVSVEGNKAISESDIKNSYYELRYLNGNLTLWQYMLLLLVAIGGIIAAYALQM